MKTSSFRVKCDRLIASCESHKKSRKKLQSMRIIIELAINAKLLIVHVNIADVNKDAFIQRSSHLFSKASERTLSIATIGRLTETAGY